MRALKMIMRGVLDGEVVRAAEAVLEADDGSLCARVVELLRVSLNPSEVPDLLFTERSSSIP